MTYEQALKLEESINRTILSIGRIHHKLRLMGSNLDDNVKQHNTLTIQLLAHFMELSLLIVYIEA